MNIVGGFRIHTKSGIHFVVAYEPGRKFIRILDFGYLKSTKMPIAEWEGLRKEQVASDWKHIADNVESRNKTKFAELIAAMREYVEGPIAAAPEAKAVKQVRRG